MVFFLWQFSFFHTPQWPVRKSFWKTNLPCWLWLVTLKLKTIRASISHSVLASQQDSRTWRNPDKRVQNKEHCICSSRYVPRQHTNAATVASLFFLAHAPPDSNCATHFSWAASFRLIWIFMNVVRRPHSIIGEIAWHGAPNPFTSLVSVWDPCTSSNCSLYSATPGRHKRSWCYGEKWEGQKQHGGRAWQAVK